MGLFMRMQDGHGTGGAAGLVDALRSLLEPGHRHTVEEREHDSLTRYTDEDGAPPAGPVDLDSGRVRIRVARTP